jgi:MFS family permease
MADLFGRRMQLLLSFVSFTIFMVVAGFATSAVYVDVFSGLIGVSCAASVPPAIGKLGAVYEKPSWRKNRAFACFSAGYPVGFVLGAFISGIATQVASWRAVFWVLAVIYFFFTIAAWWTVPPDTEQRLGGFNKETLVQFDFLGAFLAVVGLATFTASLTLAGDASSGWSTPHVPALLVIGVVCIAGCLYWQRICKHPLMPLHIWKDKNFTLLVSILCLGFYGFTGNLFWIALVFQRIDGDSPLMTAVKLLPAAIGGICVNITAALIMHRVSNKLLMYVAATSLVIASALWSAIAADISYWALSFPALLFSVVGCDFQFTVTKQVYLIRCDGVS